MSNVLHLHVKTEYWLQAKAGLKDKEYRLIKPYWIKRLEKEYDLIYYWLGYTSNKLIYVYNGYVRTTIMHKEFGNELVNVFAIDLTKPVMENVL